MLLLKPLSFLNQIFLRNFINYFLKFQFWIFAYFSYLTLVGKKFFNFSRFSILVQKFDKLFRPQSGTIWNARILSLICNICLGHCPRSTFRIFSWIIKKAKHSSWDFDTLRFVFLFTLSQWLEFLFDDVKIFRSLIKDLRMVILCNILTFGYNLPIKWGRALCVFVRAKANNKVISNSDASIILVFLKGL